MKRAYLLVTTFAITTIVQAIDLPKYADSLRKVYGLAEIGYAIVGTDSIYRLQVMGHHRFGQYGSMDTASLDDYFHLGSNSKAITAFIAARLVEQGKIKWETQFFKLFPEWKKGSDTAYYRMTLKDILSHRARIEPYTNPIEHQELPDFKGTVVSKRRQFVQHVLREKPVKRDGRVYQYSNAGYSAAALMLEKVSGKSWEQLVTEYMTASMKMRTRMGWPNLHDTMQPWGHLAQGAQLVPTPPDMEYNLSMIEPAGDISMPLPDYARYIQLNLFGLAGRDTVLRSSTFRMLHFGMEEYALGWGNGKANGRQVSEHAGSAGTFFCYTLLDPQRKLAYIIIANSSNTQTQDCLFTILDAMKAQVASH